MQSTIKLDGGKSLVVKPAPTGNGITLQLKLGQMTLATQNMDAATVGAVIVALECATGAKQ